MSFEIEKESSLNIEYFVTLVPLLYFTLYILIVINSAVYIKGVLVTSRKKLFYHYLKTDFFIDIITLIPLHLAYWFDIFWLQITFLL